MKFGSTFVLIYYKYDGIRKKRLKRIGYRIIQIKRSVHNIHFSRYEGQKKIRKNA